jgi:hypothetical protein
MKTNVLSYNQEKDTKSKKAKTFYWSIVAVVIILSLVFLSLVSFVKAATYYYISGPINNVSSWKTGSNGTGTSPTNFTSGGNTFIIWNSLGGAISPTLTGVWTIGGTNILQIGTSTGSATLTISGGTLNLGGTAILRVGATTGTVSKKLYIASNGILNITSGATTPLRVNNNGTLSIASSTFPASADVALNTGSYVDWAQTTGTTTIWQKTYENMIISGGGVKRHNGNGTLQVVGKLQMLSGALLMSNNPNATLRLSGTITGSAPIQTSNSNLTIDGTGNFGTIYFANGSTAMSIRNLTINRTGLGQITLGTNLTVSGQIDFSNGVINLNNQTLTLNGAITLPVATTNGYFIGSRNSSLVISGTGTITNNLLMSTSTLTTSSLANLTMNRTNRTLTIGNPLRIWGELTASAGTIVTNGNITIKADANQKGRIAPIGTSADISGNVTMEVFAKGGTTGWTLLSPSGISNQSLTGWSDDFAITCPTCPLSNTFTSVYTYCEPCATNNYSAAAHYVPISSINNPLTIGKGYWVYLGTSTYTTNNIIIDLTGPVVKKNFGTISLTKTGTIPTEIGWNLIGNPYPSPISFSKILTSMGSNSVNIDQSVYVWNPDLNGGAGDYAVYTPSLGSVPPVSSGGINDNIAAGQGFYVHALNNVVLSPNENWKSATNSQNNLLRTIQPLNTAQSTTVYPPSMFLLEMKGPNNYDVFTGIAVNPNATTNFDSNLDVIQLGSDYPAPQLMTTLNNYDYKINTIPLVNGTTTLEVRAITGVSGTYTLFPINLSNFSSSPCISLYDKFTNTTHNLTTGAYTFTLSDTTTVPRFILSITNNPITASVSVLQQPVCKNDLTGSINVNISSGVAPYKVILKSDNGTILDSIITSSNSYTFANLAEGNYFLEVASPSMCGSSVYPVNITSTNNIYPIAQFNLLSNDTLPLNFSSPITAINTSTNSTSITWELVGDGYTSASNTFSYMPDAEGEYILQLTVTNTCNDVSVYQWPIVIIPGPDSPSSLTYAPDGTPIFTAKLASENNTNISESNSNVIISNDEVGIFIQGINVSRCSLKVIDILGRTLYSELNINIENKFYLDKINAENQWILVNVEYEGKSVTKKIFLNRYK